MTRIMSIGIFFITDILFPEITEQDRNCALVVQLMSTLNIPVTKREEFIQVFKRFGGKPQRRN